MDSLVDVNLLLAILHERHAFSARALAWLNGMDRDASLRICRVVQMGTLRILTRPSIMQDDVLSSAEFWDGWSALMADSRFAMEPEPADFESTWYELTCALPQGQSAETDAYLAAFAQSAGLSVATFDKGFHRYSGLNLDLL